MDVAQVDLLQPFLQHTNPKRRIGALEMIASLILFILAAKPTGTLDIAIPFRTVTLRTDNEGNAFSASKGSSKKWPCSAMMVELTAQEHDTGASATFSRVKRSSNTWADLIVLSDLLRLHTELQIG